MVFLIVVLAFGLLAIVFAPLFSKQLIDDLPDMRDPVTVDLEEERDALLRAIRELDARIDLSGERRDQLRARYEAKAAQVLKRLDERQQEILARRPVACHGAQPFWPVPSWLLRPQWRDGCCRAWARQP